MGGGRTSGGAEGRGDTGGGLGTLRAALEVAEHRPPLPPPNVAVAMATPPLFLTPEEVGGGGGGGGRGGVAGTAPPNL